MIEQLTDGLGALLVIALAAVGAAVVLSIPIFLGVSSLVLIKREWLPLSYTVHSLSGRRNATLATFIGLALVVFVLTFMLMMAQGVEHTFEATGNPRNVKVVRANRPTEWNSRLSPEEMVQLAAGQEIAKDERGQPLISGEMVVLTWMPYLVGNAADDGANVAVRGVSQVAFQVHSVLRVDGRRFNPGEHEIVIGKALAGRYRGAVLGGSMTFADREWRVVGIADHGGAAYDSEIWGDFDVMAPAFRRGVATASLVLDNQDGLSTLNARIAANPQLAEISGVREDAFWKALSKNYVEFITLLGCSVAVVFSFGAILGAMNTMYAQVAARSREIGALRAIGFKRRAILTSLVMESVLLSVAAGITGVLAAALLGTLEFRFTSMETLSEITYGLRLSPTAACICVGFAAIMGYAGGLLPALRAAAVPIVTAVRGE